MVSKVSGENSNDASRLREYLLGRIDLETEREELETRLMIDDAFYEEFLFQQNELVQEYVDRELSEAEIQDFESRYLTSTAREENVRFAQALRKYVGQNGAAHGAADMQDRRENFWFSIKSFLRPIPLIAGSLLLLFVCLAVWRFFLTRSQSAEAMIAFNRAYSTERPVESRITGLNYAPFSIRRSDKDPVVDLKERQRAELILLSSDDPSAETIHALGRLYLAKKEFDQAIEELEKANRIDDGDAGIYNDLGAAYLEKGKYMDDRSSDRIDLLRKALEALDRAISLRPTLTEAYYNRAECLESSDLPSDAKDAWQKYVEIDPGSPWTDEAKAHLQKLETQAPREIFGKDVEEAFVRTFQEQNDDQAFALASRNRELIRENYLPQRLAISFIKAEPAEREIKLSALKYLGVIEKSRIGDAFAGDLAVFYSRSSGENLRLINDAQSAANRGYTLCMENDKWGEAMHEFSSARVLFMKAGDVIEAKTICDYFIAYCFYNDPKKRAVAEGLLKTVGEFCEKKNYRWFGLMNFYWWLGSQESLGYKSFTQARFDYENALEKARKMGDLYMAQKFLLSLIIKSNLVRQDGKTNIYAQQLLALSNQQGISIRQKLRNLDKIILANSETGYPAFSRALVLESVATAKSITDPAMIAETELNAAVVHIQTKAFSEAEKWLVKAEGDAGNLPEESTRRDLLSRILLNRGYLEEKRSEFPLALDYFDRSLALSDGAQNSFIVYENHKARLRVYRKAHYDAELDAEIPLTLQLADGFRKTILDEQERESFFNNEQEVNDVAVDVAFGRQDFEGAYNLAEISNSRSLLDRLGNGAAQSRNLEALFDERSASPLDLTRIREKLSPDEQILQFRVLEDKVLIWLVSRENFQTFSTRVDRVDLEANVKNYVRLIQGQDPESQNEAGKIAVWLYTTLIQPARPFLSKEKVVCIVPNRILYHLPFAALVSPENSYFIEEFTSFYSPSANIVIKSTESANEKTMLPSERALIVGNPAFDTKQLPNLANLPDSQIEARSIAAKYPTSKLLYGKDATKLAFEADYQNFEIIHFAGHYLIEPGSPLISKLVMAFDPEHPNDNFLTNGELMSKDLSNTKLVVLAGCQTGVEGYFAGEGMVGLSRTFLAAGVPLVIASQWPVDSGATSRLMQKFHDYRTTGKLSSIRSLRRVQIEMLNGPDPAYRQPYFWASFAAFGGYATY